MKNNTKQDKILLLGTTGRVGGAVLKKLLPLVPKGAVRVVTRRPESISGDISEHVEIVGGNIGTPETAEQALDGVNTVLLVLGDHPDMARQEINLIDCARKKGPIRIIKISAITAGLNPRVSFGLLHGLVEDHLIASGLPYVILRPTFFFQSLELFKDPIQRGILPAATQKGAIGFVDMNDVAAAAVTALTDNRLDGTIHILTGPKALTMTDAAKHLSEYLPRKVRHISPPGLLMPLLLRLGAGMDKWLAKQVSDLMKCCALGGEDHVSDAVLNLTGKQPTSINEYAQKAVSSFRP
jgi:uncharacterized protein YbjT (DUF2867 family)